MANILKAISSAFSQIAADLETLQIVAIFCGSGLLASLVQIELHHSLFSLGVFRTSHVAPLLLVGNLPPR